MRIIGFGAALAAFAAVAVFLYAPVIKAYFPVVDDFSLIFFSSPEYQAKPLDWITIGYSDYFKNYGAASPDFTNFSRPLVNATFYLTSLLAPHPSLEAHLIPNYVIYLVSCVLYAALCVAVLGRFDFRALVAFAIFAFASCWHPLFMAASLRTSGMMALFSLLSFLAIAHGTRRSPVVAASLSAVALILAIASHEMGLLSVIIAISMLTFFGGSMPRKTYRICVSVLLLPVLLFAIFRAAVFIPSFKGIYAFDVVRTGNLAIEALGALAQIGKYALWAFFPIDKPVELLLSGNAVTASLVLILSLLTLVLFGALVLTVFKRDAAWSWRALAAGLLIYAALQVAIGQEARHGLVTVAMAGIFWAGFFGASAASLSPFSLRNGATMALFLAPAVLVLLAFVHANQWNIRLYLGYYDMSRTAVARIGELRPGSPDDLLVLVNDRIGLHAAKSMLRLATHGHGYAPQNLLVVNGIVGPRPGTPIQVMSVVACENGRLVVAMQVPPAQEAVFRGGRKDLLAEGKNAPIAYDFPAKNSYSFAARVLGKIGFDLAPDKLRLDDAWSFSVAAPGRTITQVHFEADDSVRVTKHRCQATANR